MVAVAADPKKAAPAATPAPEKGADAVPDLNTSGSSRNDHKQLITDTARSLSPEERLAKREALKHEMEELRKEGAAARRAAPLLHRQDPAHFLAQA